MEGGAQMKNKSRFGVIQLIVLILLGSLVLFSLVIPDASTGDYKKNTTEISVIMREADGAIWSDMRLGMEQAAFNLGGELRFLSPDVDNSHSSQEALLMREIEGGTDALVIVPANPDKMETLLESVASNLRVVSMESSLSDKTMCVAPNNAAIGQSLAQLCKKEDGTVLLLDSAIDSTGVRDRLNACEKALVEQGIKVETRKTSMHSLPQNILGFVQQTGAKTVIAFEHSVTEALANLSTDEKAAVRIYGVGATNSIVSNLEKQNITAIVAWSDYAAGYLAVQAALEPASKRQINKQNFNLLFSTVKGDEIYEKQNQKLLFPVVS